MNHENFQARLKELVAEILEVNSEEIVEDALFKSEYGADSIRSASQRSVKPFCKSDPRTGRETKVNGNIKILRWTDQRFSSRLRG